MSSVRRRGDRHSGPATHSPLAYLKAVFFLCLYLAVPYGLLVLLADRWTETQFASDYLSVLTQGLREGPAVPLGVALFIQFCCIVAVSSLLFHIVQPIRDWWMRIERYVFLGHGLDGETRFLCPDHPGWGVFTVYEGGLGRRRAQGFARVLRYQLYQMSTDDPRLATAWAASSLKQLLVYGLLGGGSALLFVLITTGGSLQIAYEAGLELTASGQQRLQDTESLALAFVVDHLPVLGAYLGGAFVIALAASFSARRFSTARRELLKSRGEAYAALPTEIQPGAILSTNLIDAKKIAQRRESGPVGSRTGQASRIPNKRPPYRLYNLEFDRGFPTPVLAGFYFIEDPALKALQSYLDDAAARQSPVKVLVTDDLELMPLLPGESEPPRALINQKSFDSA
ncbi:hypothetical protein HBA54_09450 [Pelagibius litoralis]|uniref:Uncharacterized protein n=1 Tax=Pelagibius litoralis TaxID=374515 RepID=A0A967C4S3_9PROT|nr:hypothetical protein [Pelagibius litoralis]NIA68815.1 hypothetical protein [Pelagibius litoralis]